MERELKEKRAKIKAFHGLPPVKNSLTTGPLYTNIFILRIQNLRDTNCALHDNGKWNSFNFVNDCSAAWPMAFLNFALRHPGSGGYYTFQCCSTCTMLERHPLPLSASAGCHWL